MILCRGLSRAQLDRSALPCGVSRVPPWGTLPPESRTAALMSGALGRGGGGRVSAGNDNQSTRVVVRPCTWRLRAPHREGPPARFLWPGLRRHLASPLPHSVGDGPATRLARPHAVKSTRYGRYYCVHLCENTICHRGEGEGQRSTTNRVEIKSPYLEGFEGPRERGCFTAG